MHGEGQTGYKEKFFHLKGCQALGLAAQGEWSHHSWRGFKFVRMWHKRFHHLALPNSCCAPILQSSYLFFSQIYLLTASHNHSIYLPPQKFNSTDINWIFKAIPVAAFQSDKVTFYFLG